MQIFNIASIYKGVVNSDSFSVHDFDILTLYPLDFEEFLWANAEFALTREIRNHFSDFSPMGKKLHEKALSQFRLYLIIGGMPAAIMEYKKEKKLLLVGVGYKAEKKGNKLVMNLGFSHPIELEDPEGITTEAPDATTVIVKGIDKAQVGNYAANIRAYRRPEPYKGKGIKYADEVIRRKVGKTGKK